MGRRQAFAERKLREKQAQGQELSWSELLEGIEHGNLIPIISNSVTNDQLFDLDDDQLLVMGGGKANPLGWSIEEQLANTWATVIKFPLREQHWLPRVALFDRVVNSVSDRGAKNNYLQFLKEYLIFVLEDEGRLSEEEIDLLKEEYAHSSFADIAVMAGLPKPAEGGVNTLELLAKMKLPIYITTSPFDFLERAIIKDKRQPRTQVCFWSQKPTHYVDKSHDTDYTFEPTPENPLVYHIFGLEAYPESMVLNEDDYFDFLVHVASDSNSAKPALPLYLLEALSRSSLLLLGYRLRDWDFRVMFRGLIKPYPASTKKYNVAIQLDPKKFSDHETARNIIRYLEGYFDDGDFAVQFDTAHNFVGSLYARWSQSS